jgi:regulatory protein
MGSPPSETLRVVSLELKGAGGETVRVHLSDGSSFMVHGEIAEREAIRADRELTADEIASLKTRSEIVFARQGALNLLSRSPQTRKGLLQKLRLRGFSEDAARCAVSRMIELGYIDDRSYAESWVSARLDSRAEGWKALSKGLVQRGVPRAVADEVVSRLCTDEVELEKARRLVSGLPPRKAAARLTARGFRSRTIGRALREHRGPDPEDDGA